MISMTFLHISSSYPQKCIDAIKLRGLWGGIVDSPTSDRQSPGLWLDRFGLQYLSSFPKLQKYLDEFVYRYNLRFWEPQLPQDLFTFVQLCSDCCVPLVHMRLLAHDLRWRLPLETHSRVYNRLLNGKKHQSDLSKSCTGGLDL